MVGEMEVGYNAACHPLTLAGIWSADPLSLEWPVQLAGCWEALGRAWTGVAGEVAS